MDKINEIVGYIGQLKSEFRKDIQTDYAIHCDAYENIGKLKVCEKIEKFIKKLQGRR